MAIHNHWNLSGCLLALLALCRSQPLRLRTADSGRRHEISTGSSSKGPLPTKAQQIYADHEIMALIHFNMGTYYENGDPACNKGNWLGLEGSHNPAMFNPYLLDTDQWAAVLQRLGAKHAVLTAKHGCGFLLWPTKVPLKNAATNQTQSYDYAVGRPGISAFQADLLEQFVSSMRKVGMGVGFYYSLKNNFLVNMKDHHFINATLMPGQVLMTKEDYEEMVLGHLRELWTNYGQLTEHWFDFGYTQSIQARLEALLQELQPTMMVWRGQGITNNTVAWVGTESGFPIGDDIWSTGCEGQDPGHPDDHEWCPKGCDTTLQDNDLWFYSPGKSIRSLQVMVNLYHKTVGRNGVLELDVAVDRTGRIQHDHAQRYMELGDYIKACYGKPLASWKDQKGYLLEYSMSQPMILDRIMLREDQWQGGQRVRQYAVYVQLASTDGNDSIMLFSRGHSIGNKRIDVANIGPSVYATEPVKVTKIRIHVEVATDIPWFREIAIFAPCPDPNKFTISDASSMATFVSYEV
jgi:alpha-L-fucosidase